jgi:hypothetical protein
MEVPVHLFEMEAGPTPFLIIVHPGSCCGSANMNLGKSQANGDRDALAHDISAWTGNVMVIDGEMSDELPYYGSLNSAIENAVAKAEIGFRIFGCDDLSEDWVGDAMGALRKLNLSKDTPIEITGAWHHPDHENTGCCNAVRDALRHQGFKANIRWSALELSLEDMG